MATEADRGARDLGVIKVLRAEPLTVRLTEVARGASNGVVPKVQKVALQLIFANIILSQELLERINIKINITSTRSERI